MRYEKGHKDTTRHRILDTASRLFRENGISETAIADIMSAAGLTNGAFYTHFASKEALVRAALVDALENQLESMVASGDDMVDLAAMVATYLDTQHRDAPGSGCPSAAMLPELGRRPHATRVAYTNGIRNIVEVLSRISGKDPRTARSTAISVFALALGSLQLARAVTDAELSDQILADGREAAIALIDRSAHADQGIRPVAR